MTGEFTTLLDFEAYKAANWLTLRRRWFWRGALKYVAWMTPVFMLIGIGGNLLKGEFDPITLFAGVVTGILFASGCLAITWLWFLFSIPRAARKTWAQLHLDGLPTQHEFDTNGIHIENARGSSNFDWSMVAAWIEDERLLLFFRTRNMFHAIPKAQVPANTLADLKAALAAAKVPTRL